MKQVKIRKGDPPHVRKAKSNFKNKIKRKDKIYYLSFPLIQSRRSGKFLTTGKKNIRFNLEIEKLLAHNINLVVSTKELKVKLNKDFSLFNDPGKVMISLIFLLKHAKTLANHPRIIYDGFVSFGALYLIDNLCWEVGKKRKWIIKTENFPTDEKSILANLRSSISSEFEDENEYLINERVVLNRKNGDPTAKQQYKAKAKNITDMIQEAMRISYKNPSYELPFEIHQAIKSAIGEQFDNIHLHALGTNNGTLCCFFNKKNCCVTILIYNFGETIAKTLINSELPSNVLEEINKILKIHTHNKVLNFTSNSQFTVENALTLLAIQEGISSKLIEDPTRGYGFIDFISHCFDLSPETTVSIISGKTAIKIDKTYPSSMKMFLGLERKMIALNKDNNIYTQPDPSFVKNIGVDFNGVIIETTIPLRINNEN